MHDFLNLGGSWPLLFFFCGLGCLRSSCLTAALLWFACSTVHSLKFCDFVALFSTKCSATFNLWSRFPANCRSVPPCCCSSFSFTKLLSSVHYICCSLWEKIIQENTSLKLLLQQSDCWPRKMTVTLFICKIYDGDSLTKLCWHFFLLLTLSIMLTNIERHFHKVEG